MDASDIQADPLVLFDEHGSVSDFWAPEPTGDDARDYARGLAFGRAALTHEREHTPNFVFCCLATMLAKQRFGAIEHGFVASVVKAARAGILN